MASGYQYPLSVLDMLKNIVIAICFIYTLMRGPHLRAMIKVTALLTALEGTQ